MYFGQTVATVRAHGLAPSATPARAASPEHQGDERQDRGSDPLGDLWTRPFDHALEPEVLRDQMVEIIAA
jgi:hypothetical protein